MTLLQKTQKAILSRRSMLRSAAAAAMFGPLFKATEGSVSAQQKVNRNSVAERLEDHRYARLPGGRELRLPAHQDLYQPGRLRVGRGARRGGGRHRPGSEGAPGGQEPAEHRGQPEDRAPVRQPRAHGRRLQRGGHGAARYRRQGLRRSGVSADRQEEPRSDSHLRRHHQITRIPRSMPSACASARRWG